MACPRPAAAAGRAGWWVAAAAAAVAAIVTGTVVLASGGNDERPTAARPTTRERAAAGSSTTAPAAEAPAPAFDGAATTPPAQDKSAAPATTVPPASGGSPTDSVAAAPVDLGNLGDVTDVAALRSRIEAAETAGQASPTPLTTTFACAAALAKAEPDLAPAQAVGAATYKGDAATVAVTSRPDGTQVAVVVVDRGCVVHDPVTL